MVHRIHLYFICLFVYFLNSTDAGSITRVDPLVNTKQGLIQGIHATDGDYSMFMGIPYARVDPTNPFGASIPAEPFDGIFEAVDDSAICPQVEEFNNTITGSLDCLHINVYVPTTAASKNKLPVLVWIYGGAFIMGFHGRYMFGPKYLVEHDVILVTMNYRVGPYGFMCLDTPEVPGNSGFKDQLLALRWIKNNIEAFGGDSNKITVFGESAGGASVDYHLLSPTEKLFDQAILQSGSSLSIFTVPDKDAAQKLAAHLGFVTDDKSNAISFLATVETKLVILASIDLGINFVPCVEQQFDGVEGFILEDWTEQAQLPKLRNMPIIIGYNTDESLFAFVNQPETFFENLNIFETNLAYSFDLNHPKLMNLENIVRQFYIGDDEISIANKFDISDFESDLIFLHPTYRSIARYIENNSGNVYHYMFQYIGNRNFLKLRLNTTEGGAFHADELGYLFDMGYFNDIPLAAEDQIMINRITTLWTNFVKFGNPTPETSELIPVQWTPITKNSLRYALDINSDLSLITSPFHSRMAFWDIIYKLRENINAQP